MADNRIIKTITENDGGRLDKTLAVLIPDASRSYLQKLIEQGLVTVNGRPADKKTRVSTGDEIAVEMPDTVKPEIEPEDIPLAIAYEDDDLLVVNKPAMMPIHESHNHQGDTLQNCVALYLQQQGKSGAFRAVGRLDKGTSGLVVCALNSHAAARLSGKVEKTYYAIATAPFAGEGTIDAPIWRPDPMKTLRAVDERGDRAVTHWKALASDGALTFLEIRLETGRTHQIRVHFAHLGAPLLGDTMYGTPDERIPHQALHCGALTLTHPVTGKVLHCEAPLPPEMVAVCQTLNGFRQQTKPNHD